LKFNQPFEKSSSREGIGVMQPNALSRGFGVTLRNWGAPHEAPLLARFLGKLVLDILPAALASVIGGFLFTQYQFGHAAASRVAAEQVTPASAEMIQLVRDEHAAIVDYLKTQSAAEQSRLAAQDQDSARAMAAAKTADDATAATAAAAPRSAATVVAAKPAATRAKAPVTLAALPPPHPPLVIAQAEQTDGVAPTDRLARDPDSLLAKTLDLKDHVVAATRHVVSAIGDVFASVTERIGGANPGAPSSGRQFNS
jgi:hypothetical protein